MPNEATIIDKDEERELILRVSLPYFGKQVNGDQLMSSIKRELELQFGGKIGVERLDDWSD